MSAILIKTSESTQSEGFLIWKTKKTKLKHAPLLFKSILWQGLIKFTFRKYCVAYLTLEQGIRQKYAFLKWNVIS